MHNSCNRRARLQAITFVVMLLVKAISIPCGARLRYDGFMKKLLIITAAILFITGISLAEEEIEQQKPSHIDTLTELFKSTRYLDKQINEKNSSINEALTEEENNRLKLELENLSRQRSSLTTRFEKIATGVDTSILSGKTEESEGITADFQLLIEPLLKGAKHATVNMRQKAELQDQITYYQKILPKIALAVGNLFNLRKNELRPEVDKSLKNLQQNWQQQLDLIANDLIAAEQQLDIMKQNETGLTESLQKGAKDFFKTRGRFFLEGLLAFIAVLVLSRLFYRVSVKLFPVIKQSHRSFKIRLLDLVYRVLTTIAAVLAPMVVFYQEEDWVLFSIGLLVLFAITWSLRTFIPKFWQQGRLLLNIGRVRENERLEYKGIPWLVKDINIFTKLENPTSGLRLRIPIEELSSCTSRPLQNNEPWFPCKKGDWLLLNSGYFGRITGLSLEMVEMVDRGNSHRTFQTSTFLAQDPVNLSTGFRIREIIGISYQHQAESCSIIPQQLKEFILDKINQEEFSEMSNNVQVEFKGAADSSINLVVLADFNSDAAPIYRCLERFIRQWCVEACTKYGWNIPFPQLTIHKP